MFLIKKVSNKDNFIIEKTFLILNLYIRPDGVLFRPRYYYFFFIKNKYFRIAAMSLKTTAKNFVINEINILIKTKKTAAKKTAAEFIIINNNGGTVTARFLYIN